MLADVCHEHKITVKLRLIVNRQSWFWEGLDLVGFGIGFNSQAETVHLPCQTATLVGIIHSIIQSSRFRDSNYCRIVSQTRKGCKDEIYLCCLELV
jgi:hypothetical protein